MVGLFGIVLQVLRTRCTIPLSSVCLFSSRHLITDNTTVVNRFLRHPTPPLTAITFIGTWFEMIQVDHEYKPRRLAIECCSEMAMDGTFIEAKY